MVRRGCRPYADCPPPAYSLSIPPYSLMFRCGRFAFALDRPLVMGIINITPDSFSGDGILCDTVRAIEQGLAMRAAGADLLDLGGASTRPGAEPVPAEEEMARVLPVLAGLRACGAAISVDTMQPEVMTAALAAGADMINDVAALRAPGAMAAVADSTCGICLMHMQGTPRSMQDQPHYDDVVGEVADFLAQRRAACVQGGIDPQRILIDPGFGFGKTLRHNVDLFKRIDHLADMAPVLVGVSRKSMLGHITARPVQERVVASATAALLAAMQGAAILRVHDVAATVDALKIWQTLGARQ